MKVKNGAKESIAVETEKINKTDKPLAPESAAKDERVLAGRELSLGRTDLSLRQSFAAGAAEAVACEADACWGIGARRRDRTSSMCI